VEDTFDGDFGSFEAVVISESINSLSPESYDQFRQFVNGGGCLILTGDHGEGEDEFLNNTFGFNVGITTTSQDPADTVQIQNVANTTSFAFGPSVLAAADLTAFFSNTPGSIIYNGALGVGVFTTSFGQGVVSAIGWDYCCPGGEEGGPASTEDQILAWYEVANRAFDQCTGFVPSRARPIPTLSELGLIATAGILGLVGLFTALRRRKATA